MGRIMSFDQDGRRVRDFDKSEHDFLRRYGRTPEEVMDENAKLRQQLADVTESMGRVEERCAKLREQVDNMTPIALYAASERERDRMRELGVDA